MSSIFKPIGYFFAALSFVPGFQWAAFVSSAAFARDAYVQQKKQRRQAIAEYNASLQDRLEMVDLQPQAPRTLVLGRVRYVEGVRRRWTSGDNDEYLTMIVSLAGHEIDAVEQVWFDDVLLNLDYSGNVLTEPYFKSNQQPSEATITVSGGNGSVNVAPDVPLSGVLIGVKGNAVLNEAVQAPVAVAGSVLSITGAAEDGEYVVAYAIASGTSTARVRVYLGGAGQNVGLALATEFPGKITSADKFEGIALLVVTVRYDPDVYPQGRPNVTAVMRGAKCYDPRTTLTVWTENPALHALHYATWAHGWALQAGDYNTADVSAAATACDVSTDFPMTIGEVTTNVTLPRYRCGITITAADDHAEAMDSIVETMAGQHGWAGGVWRLRAGTLAATATTVGQEWLVNARSGGQADSEPVITAVQAIPRAQRYNRVTGSCVDPAQRYQLLPFPAVEDSVLVAAEGERPIEVEYAGCTHIAHAQHMASMTIRQAQAGLVLDLVCGEQASTLELFDVVELTMQRYGFSAKPFVVLGWTWQQTGAYRLRLQETAAALYTVEAELVGRDPAPDSDLPAPWDVETLSGLAVTSGTEPLVDGSVLTRTRITWVANTSEAVLAGGRVEVQFREVGTEQWQIWEEDGAATSATVPGLRGGVFYTFRARFVSAPPLRVRGQWGNQAVHQVAGPPSVVGATFVVTFADEDGVCYSNIG